MPFLLMEMVSLIDSRWVMSPNGKKGLTVHGYGKDLLWLSTIKGGGGGRGAQTWMAPRLFLTITNSIRFRIKSVLKSVK